MRHLLVLFLTVVCIRLAMAAPILEIDKLGEWGTGFYDDICVKGKYVYCSASGAGFEILDIGNPANPQKISQFDCDGYMKAIQVNDHYIYILEDSHGMAIIDVSNPSSPVRVGGCNLFFNPNDLCILGNYAYVIGSNRLKVIDISNPSSPRAVGGIAIDGAPMDIEVKENYAYISTSNYMAAYHKSGLFIIDISDPKSPKPVGIYDNGTDSCIFSVRLKGNYAYLTSYTELIVVDISNPANPWNVTSRMLMETNLRSDNELDVLGNYAFVSIQMTGLMVFDISQPDSPTLVGNHDDEQIMNIVAAGNYGYFTCFRGGLKILDLHTPSSPTPIGGYDNSGNPLGVFVNGHHAFVVDQGKNFIILDISAPTTPTLVGTIPSLYGGGNTADVFVIDNYAYLSAGGLKIYDVSNPASPTLVGHYSTSSAFNEVYVRNGYAYLPLNKKGLEVIDVSNPAAPFLVGKYTSTDFLNGIYVSGDYAYLTQGGYGLKILDISNLTAPHLEYQFNSPVTDVFVSGEIAYIVNNERQLLIMEVTTPSSPVRLGYYTSHYYINSVYVKGNYAILSLFEGGIEVLDISNPKSPVLVGHYNTTGRVIETAVKDNKIYVADGTSGKFLVLQYHQSPGPPTIHVNREQLTFTAIRGSNGGATQTLAIENTGTSALNWTATTDKNWLGCYPSSGRNSGDIFISIDINGLSTGTYSGEIILSDPLATNSPQTVPVTLKVYETGQSSPPFGEYATPVNGSIVSGSVPFTGWALDDMGVQSVQLFREAGDTLVYIGDAVFVEGARPDVETAYPGYPNNEKAGWGYMLLTHFLPNSNGTFTIRAAATDTDGNQVTLGKKTIIVDNANAVIPFGAIDTPEQGGVAGGNEYINFGWALTPRPNTIPKDGTTILVWVDGKSLGHPVYNRTREDIAGFFPGYNNSAGAGGYFSLETTAYSNGVHTISWSVTDNAGNSDGIGSRYFTIQNSSSRQGASGTGTDNSGDPGAAPPKPGDYLPHTQIDHLNINHINPGPVGIVKGYNRDLPRQAVYPDETGIIDIEINELERIEIDLHHDNRDTLPGTYSGYLRVGDTYKPLPAGSTLDREKGILYWQTAAGYVGEYRLVIIHRESSGSVDKIELKVTITPRSHRLN